MREALRNLPKANDGPAAPVPRSALDEPVWHLALDEEVSELGPLAAAALPLPLVALELDPITMADDSKFIDSIQAQANLPDFVKQGLPKFF